MRFRIKELEKDLKFANERNDELKSEYAKSKTENE